MKDERQVREEKGKDGGGKNEPSSNVVLLSTSNVEDLAVSATEESRVQFRFEGRP